MKKKIFITAAAAIAVVISVITVILIPHNTAVEPIESETTEGTTEGIVIKIPEEDDTAYDDDMPVETVGENETILTPPEDTEEITPETEPTETEPVVEPTVIDVKVDEEKKAETTTVPTADKTESTQKITDTPKGIDSDGDVINDILEEKKQAAIAKAEEKADEEHPVIVGEEITVYDDTEKPDIIVYEEEADKGDVDDGKSAVAEYVPQSGDHPFVDPVDGGITGEVNVEDLVGEGEDRPGEGIHF